LFRLIFFHGWREHPRLPAQSALTAWEFLQRWFPSTWQERRCLFDPSNIKKSGPVLPKQQSRSTGFRSGLKSYCLANALVLLAVLLLVPPPALGQEAIRMSIAGSEAAEMEKKTGDLSYYNLALGPVSLRFQAEMGFGFTDNVNYTSTNRVSDLALMPAMNMRAFWPISENNSLFFDTGIGYTTYLRTSSKDSLNITPDSNLTFRMYVGDFVINFHDRFSMTENVQQNPTGSGSFVELENTTGVSADWDLNKLILSFGYDHDLVSYPNSDFESSDHSSELFNAQAAFELNPSSTAGLQAGGGLTYYTQDSLSDNTHFSIGPFYQAQVTDYIKVTISAGYVSYFFSSSGTATNISGQNGGYADLTLAHRVNRWLDYTVSGGRQFTSSVGTDLLDLYYANWEANWHVIRDVSLSTTFTYQHGNSSGGTVETFDQFGAGMSLGYPITQKLAGSIRYNFWQKNSDVAVYGYVQNMLVLDFTYGF
jgi:hypothetical protein